MDLADLFTFSDRVRIIPQLPQAGSELTLGAN